MKVDIIMMSKFGKSDGGRETWFYNFMSSLDNHDDKIKFKLYSLSLDDNNVVEEFLFGKHLIAHNGIKLSKKKTIPLTFLFIVKLFFLIIKKNNRSEKVVAIGNIYEMIACFLCYPPLFYKGEKIVWLRTISRREFGPKTKILRYPLILIEYLLLKYYFDKVLTNGNDTGEFYKNIGIDNIVINNGIVVDKWYKNINPKESNHKVRVSYIGRLEKNKGIEYFLDLIKMSKDLNNVEFLIIGKGSYKNKIENLCLEMKNITYLGEVSNNSLPVIMSDIDVSVALTFSNEFIGGGGLSNALLEQMCNGLLIVAWDNPIFRQILDLENSLLIKQGDLNSMVNCLKRISLDFNSFYDYRVRSQDKSLEYSFEKNKIKFLEILNENK